MLCSPTQLLDKLTKSLRGYPYPKHLELIHRHVSTYQTPRPPVFHRSRRFPISQRSTNLRFPKPGIHLLASLHKYKQIVKIPADLICSCNPSDPLRDLWSGLWAWGTRAEWRTRQRWVSKTRVPSVAIRPLSPWGVRRRRGGRRRRWIRAVVWRRVEGVVRGLRRRRSRSGLSCSWAVGVPVDWSLLPS